MKARGLEDFTFAERLYVALALTALIIGMMVRDFVDTVRRLI
ncbi:MAG: hypothetical protein ACTSPB_01180 [Candidatus Thorarchaeota archaeon]